MLMKGNMCVWECKKWKAVVFAYPKEKRDTYTQKRVYVYT